MGYPDHSRLVTVASEMGVQKSLLLYEDGSRSLDWVVSGTGADPAVSISGTFSFLGEKSIKMKTRGTSPADGDTATAVLRIPFPYRKRLFAGLRFFSNAINIVEWAEFKITINDGAQAYEAAVRFNFTVDKGYYTDAAGALVEITAAAGGNVDKSWHHMGMELDLNTMKWVKGFVNGATIDNSDVFLDNTGADSDRFIKVELKMTNEGTNAGTTYWDTIYVGDCDCL